MSATPTVYFIDDSATMREVIKIAFRRENINVVACQSATTAIGQMEQVKPDVVISDLIMPEKDGYEVCQFVKQHPRMSRTPVILMSGVVNRAVAEKAFAVKADELIRKPFQPQDLIARVRHLLNPKAPVVRQAPPVAATAASAALSSIFATQVNGIPMQVRGAAGVAARAVPVASAMPQAVSVPGVGSAAQLPQARIPVMREGSPAKPAAAMPTAAVVAKPPATARAIGGNGGSIPLDMQKLKIEVLRLEGLVTKLKAELQAEREYSRALEEHVKTLQEAD
jgi:CheY-like chemotaxis protein